MPLYEVIVRVEKIEAHVVEAANEHEAEYKGCVRASEPDVENVQFISLVEFDPVVFEVGHDE
jgi:hypothetical protein